MGYKVRGGQGQGSMASRTVGPLYSTADRPSTRPHASSPLWTECRPSTAAHPPRPMVFAAALRVAIRPAARHAPAAAVERVRAEAGPGHDRRAGLHVLPRRVQGLRRLRVVRRAQAQVRRAVTLHGSAAGPGTRFDRLGLCSFYGRTGKPHASDPSSRHPASSSTSDCPVLGTLARLCEGLITQRFHLVPQLTHALCASCGRVGRCVGVLEMPLPHELSGRIGLPCLGNPSDHLPLVARFALPVPDEGEGRAQQH